MGQETGAYEARGLGQRRAGGPWVGIEGGRRALNAVNSLKKLNVTEVDHKQTPDLIPTG